MALNHKFWLFHYSALSVRSINEALMDGIRLSICCKIQISLLMCKKRSMTNFRFLFRYSFMIANNKMLLDAIFLKLHQIKLKAGVLI